MGGEHPCPAAGFVLRVPVVGAAAVGAAEEGEAGVEGGAGAGAGTCGCVRGQEEVEEGVDVGGVEGRGPEGVEGAVGVGEERQDRGRGEVEGEEREKGEGGGEVYGECLWCMWGDGDGNAKGVVSQGMRW